MLLAALSDNYSTKTESEVADWKKKRGFPLTAKHLRITLPSFWRSEITAAAHVAFQCFLHGTVKNKSPVVPTSLHVGRPSGRGPNLLVCEVRIVEVFFKMAEEDL